MQGDYLLFLGRMSPDKGAHRAVTIALESGLPLKIAGKCAEPAEQAYFDEHVRPHLGGDREYVGEVSHGEKVELLQHARATVFPISWQEPFGLVMIESMACGTPVIATRWGAVPEVIEDGRTGIIVDDWRQTAGALEAADALDPAVLRSTVEERFTPERMVADYVAAYEAAPSLVEVSLRVRPRDPEARRAGARRARGRAALRARRHGDRRPPRPAAAGRARDRRDGSHRPVRDLQLPPVRHDRAGRARVRERARRAIANRLGAQALWLSLGFGLAIAAGVIALAPQIVELMGGEGDTADYAVTYMRIAALGLPFAFLALGGQGYLRGRRRPAHAARDRDRRQRRVNVILEVLFVYGFGWGIEGSAWGTVIAQAGMGAAFIVVILRAARGDTRPSRELMRRLLVIGRHIFVRTAALLSAFTLAGAVDRALRRRVARRAPDRLPALDLPRVRPRRDRDRRAGARRPRSRRGRQPNGPTRRACG